MKNSRKKFLKWRRENYPLLETRHEESRFMEIGWNAAQKYGTQNTSHNSESTPLQGPYCNCRIQGGTVDLCAACGRIIR